MLPSESESESENDGHKEIVSDDASLLEEESLDGGKSGLDCHPYIPSCQTIRDLHGGEFMRMFFNVSIYNFGLRTIKCYDVSNPQDKVTCGSCVGKRHCERLGRFSVLM